MGHKPQTEQSPRSYAARKQPSASMPPSILPQSGPCVIATPEQVAPLAISPTCTDVTGQLTYLVSYVGNVSSLTYYFTTIRFVTEFVIKSKLVVITMLVDVDLSTKYVPALVEITLLRRTATVMVAALY